MEIVRNADGTLVVPVTPTRQHHTDDGADTAAVEAAADTPQNAAPTHPVLHPVEGGYDEALAEWDVRQNPDRPPVVSTASGRQEAMTLVHAVAESPDHEVKSAVQAVHDPAAS